MGSHGTVKNIGVASLQAVELVLMTPRLLSRKALVYRLIFEVMSKCAFLHFYGSSYVLILWSKIANHLVPQASASPSDLVHMNYTKIVHGIATE